MQPSPFNTYLTFDTFLHGRRTELKRNVETTLNETNNTIFTRLTIVYSNELLLLCSLGMLSACHSLNCHCLIHFTVIAHTRMRYWEKQIVRQRQRAKIIVHRNTFNELLKFSNVIRNYNRNQNVYSSKNRTKKFLIHVNGHCLPSPSVHIPI